MFLTHDRHNILKKNFNNLETVLFQPSPIPIINLYRITNIYPSYQIAEYGMGRRASTQGDVFSFGVLLLEMVTRKRPTGIVFHEGASLQEWVKSHYPHNLDPIIKDALVKYAHTSCSTKQLHDMVLELIELGLICTQYNPSTRPTMLDVAHEMASWKEYLFRPSTE